MSTRIANIISLVSIALLAAYVAWMYAALPDPMPTHWNAAGQADDYMPKLQGAVVLAAVPAFIFIIFKLIPVVSPRGFRTESFTGVLNILMTASVVFGSVIGIVAIQAALGANFNISTIVMVAVGLLLMVLGNFMGKVRKNFFIGIRTPWTLASDEVWAKTHRLGGWCLVIAGAAMALLAVLAPKVEWIIYIVVVLALIPVVYSYIAYRRIEGFAPDPDLDDS
ncbi:MAG: SdpI family protein [Gammaproteobacteria bacterium]|nr:SdpI family protein [Gammaproteobacteria bacterium]